MTGVQMLELDQFFGEAASATRVWVSVGAICALVSIASWLIHETVHQWRLARTVRAGLDESDAYGRKYVDELLQSLGREREEDGRALFVLRVSLWVLVWLLTTA